MLFGITPMHKKAYRGSGEPRFFHFSELFRQDDRLDEASTVRRDTSTFGFRIMQPQFKMPMHHMQLQCLDKSWKSGSLNCSVHTDMKSKFLMAF
jgi:hypothetical protein